jgi:membrane protein required for colicin V production
MQLFWVDYIIIAVVGLSLITGMVRGFVKEIVALAVWGLALWLAFNYANLLEPWLSSYIQDKTARSTAAFIGVLLGTLIAGGVVNATLSLILKQTGLSGPDRLLGLAFGAVRGVFIVALLMSIIKMTSLPYKEYTNRSQLCASFDPLVITISAYMPNVMQKVKSLDPEEKIMDIIPSS